MAVVQEGHHGLDHRLDKLKEEQTLQVQKSKSENFSLQCLSLYRLLVAKYDK